MSSRLADERRRRAEREARERELEDAREHRARQRRIIGAAGVAALLLAGVLALTTLDNDAGSGTPAGAARPFAQHYDGLGQRRDATNVTTMAAPTANEHTHPHLALWVNGRRITVPANIGIAPGQPASQMAALHTHDDSGTIHNEGQADATLGQFFAVWGVPLSKDRLGPYRAGEGRVVQIWVDGKPSQAWDSLKLADGQDIRIAFGPRRSAPPAL